MGEVLKGASLWDALEGKKETSKEEVGVKFGDVEGKVTVVYRDYNVIQKVDKEIDKELPEKPKVKFKGLGKIELPSDEYPKFNDHEKALEWEEKAEPVREKRLYRRVFEFMAEDERPCEDPEKGTQILQDRLRYPDAVKIVNKGFELNGLNSRIDDARKNS